MSITLYVCVGLVVLIVVVAVIMFISSGQSLKSMDRKTAAWLNTLPLDELERKVYRYDSEYFKLIGEENESVREFKKIIENKDISALYKNWRSSFIGEFIALERKTGYEGRPMLMDYYFGYELEIKELHERKKAGL